MWRPIKKKISIENAYPAAIPQCVEAASAAFSNKERPTRATVGTIVSGVTYLNKTPTIPEKFNFNLLKK